MKEPIIYAVGETVFDIIFRNYQPEAAKPGGSAFNAIISLARLGIPVNFISEVGSDRIGNHILEFLNDNGVGAEYVMKYEGRKTAISLAFLNDSSDAEYDFYKDYPNQRLNEEFPSFDSQDYLLFGSFYGLNPALRPQIEQLLEIANLNGTFIYYDPNFRSSHLSDLDQLKEIIEKNFIASTIVRASDEDMFNIYGAKNLEQAWNKISSFSGYFVYTANSHGVDLVTPKFHLHVEVDRIEPVSTIGAGDTFNAGILFGLYRRGVTASSIGNLEKSDWEGILRTASIFSREVCLSYDNYISVELGRGFL